MYRAIVENYFTFYYLFCDKIDDEEKEFRLNVFKYSGLKQRSEFVDLPEEFKLQQEKEIIHVESLKELVSNSKFFSIYTKNERKDILKGIKPRLFNTWRKLNELSSFQKSSFKNFYSFNSSYAHSEFISVLQIKSQGYGINENSKSHYTLMLHHSLICKCIIDLTNLFPSVDILFSKQDENLIKEVNYLNLIAGDSGL